MGLKSQSLGVNRRIEFVISLGCIAELCLKEREEKRGSGREGNKEQSTHWHEVFVMIDIQQWASLEFQSRVWLSHGI